MPASSPSSLSPEDFTGHEEVKACIARLKEKFGEANPLVVSDVLDENGCQYVNLVQKGGGVLGVALVGYTYILEAMNIRFLRLAGTSAGAINTALMTVIDEKKDAKSEKVLKSICDLDFFKLVDGHFVARYLIKKFITHSDFTSRLKKWLTGILVILAVLLAGDFVLLGLQHIYAILSGITLLAFVLTGFYLLLLGVAGIYTYILLKRLKNSGYGINPGDYFYNWIKGKMSENGVHTVSDLNRKAANLSPLHLRIPHELGLQELKGDITLIASELVTQNKIQFPQMCYLFRKDIDTLQPAGFIRASMSIPVFFESYFITDIPCRDEEIRKLWSDTFNERDPPQTARFVDGGILSNFPINLFYNQNVKVPRVPTFGIDLDDSRPGDQTKHAVTWSLGGYLGRIFNTVRSYYDKDFLLKNKVYEKGIGVIHLPEYNWLNFFLTDEEKKDMFVKGARAATEFLLGFNWEDYKNNRTELQKILTK